MNNTRQGKRRRYVEVGLAVVCLVVLWAASVKTSWVPRAGEAARALIVRPANEDEGLKHTDEDWADELSTPRSKPESVKDSLPLDHQNQVTAEQLLQKDFQIEKESLEAEFKQQWDILNRSFGPASNDTPDTRAARNRALGNLHAKYAAQASRLTLEHKTRMKKFADIDRLAQAGLLNAGPNEVKMHLYLSDDVEQATFPGRQNG